MLKILIVDHDQAALELLRVQLQHTYDVTVTTKAEVAFVLALSLKPDAILLDLLLPNLAGFEVCQTLNALSYTSGIPIFLMTEDRGEKYQQYCKQMGAAGYVHKPIDFAELKDALARELPRKTPERRVDLRVRLHVQLELKGSTVKGKRFAVKVSTQNVSAGGFLTQCTFPLWKGAIVKVYLEGDEDRYAGIAQVMRSEPPDAKWPWYGFRFLEVTSEWLLKRD
jgi:two-component system, OmpR family, response regulator